MLATAPLNLLSGLAILTAAGPQARAAPTLAVGEPVVGLAAGNDAVAAVTTAGDVLLLDGEGAVRRRVRVPGAGSSSGRPARPRGNSSRSGPSVRDGFLIGAGVPADDDFNDSYDVDSEVEDPTNVLVDDAAAAGTPGRRATSLGTARGVVVAAGGRTVWLAGPEGLMRISVDSDAPPERVGGSTPEGWSALAASEDGHWLAGVRGGWLVRSADGGRTFDALSPMAVPSRGLAVTKGGEVLLVDREGARLLGGAQSDTVSAWPGALDACPCDGGTLVLADNGVAVMDSAGAARAADAAGDRGSRPSGPGESERRTVRAIAVPDDVDRLACDGRGAHLAGRGTSLWISSDAGQTWSRRPELPSVGGGTVALARGVAWAVTSEGLWRVPLESPLETSREASPSPFVQEPTRDSAPASAAAGAALAPVVGAPSASFIDLSLEARRPPWWGRVLPRVDLAFTWATATGRRDVRAFLLLSFAVGRDSDRAFEHRSLVRQLQQRRREAGSVALALSSPPSAALDPIDAQERAALARMLEEAPP